MGIKPFGESLGRSCGDGRVLRRQWQQYRTMAKRMAKKAKAAALGVAYECHEMGGARRWEMAPSRVAVSPDVLAIFRASAAISAKEGGPSSVEFNEAAMSEDILAQMNW